MDVLLRVHATVAPALTSGPCPVAFSDEWLALPADDPRRADSVTRAALAWWNVWALDPTYEQKMAEASHAIAEMWPDQAVFHKEARQLGKFRGAVPDQRREPL
jgi:hypothetical protein